MNDLEKEFRAACKEVNKKIKLIFQEAEVDAVKLAEKHGVPFRRPDPFKDYDCYGMPWEGYVPKSFEKKFGELRPKDEEDYDAQDEFNQFMSDLTGIGGYYISEGTHGWVGSKTC